MNKNDLRKQYKTLRTELSDEQREQKSLAIANQLLNVAIWDKTYYHLFLSIEVQKEIDTEFILQILAGKDKEIVLSKSNFENGEMTHFLLTDNTKIKKNEYFETVIASLLLPRAMRAALRCSESQSKAKLKKMNFN